MENGRGGKKQKISLPILLAALAVVVLGVLPSALGSSWPVWLHLRSAPQPAGSFAVHFIDVGQGDCALIESGGQFMIIDGGERGAENTVTAYLQDRGVKKLDYVVATHAHSDHIGGLAYGVLPRFPAGEIIAPRYSEESMPTTKTYEKFLEAVAARVEDGAKATYAKPGTQYTLGDASFEVLGPLEDTGDEYNNSSVVILLEYGGARFLFTGDVEKSAEKALVKTYGEGLRADVLKVPHHGSSTSSTKNLLDAVQPAYAVICCGQDNSYNHPNAAVVARLLEHGITVLRTDLDGTIVMTVDGGVKITKERGMG
ncbi:MAG: MBL fold metallo-hydrolase [Oscillospiraceae bacterium]|jgi:DNA internalization-related competence protein ComEC/Rec2|nr:MBL fold metallo-hydrolase [Oscillospiraceae bacterium]